MLSWRLWDEISAEEKPEISAYDLCPPTQYDDLMIMRIAKGVNSEFDRIYNELEVAEVYRRYALQLLAEYSPPPAEKSTH